VSAHQARYAIRCEWGAQGLDQFRSECDVLIVIDVLSFSTAVDVGVSRGARIYPYPWKDGKAEDFAHDNRAAVAASIRKARAGVYSLSPTSLLDAPASLRLVLPSPNGGSLCYAARGESVFTACLRNARAVDAAAVAFDEARAPGALDTRRGGWAGFLRLGLIMAGVSALFNGLGSHVGATVLARR